ncbi:carotenoid oxygenase family protein [Streptomyces monashensis]|uniref:Dioxygenase n=1 Tax=Streptomyces monashensis TaxID=1678012 RepID=A0A1S2PK36_9ACTN|nr:hypothetical protein BIV23_36525 [Streptomyces monashensis]
MGTHDFRGTLRGAFAAYAKYDAVAGAPMMHDFALTGRYVVVFDLPVTFDAAAADRGAPVPCVRNRKHPTRVGVMPRTGGPVRWFGIDPVSCSHTLNAYDEGGSAW